MKGLSMRFLILLLSYFLLQGFKSPPLAEQLSGSFKAALSRGIGTQTQSGKTVSFFATKTKRFGEGTFKVSEDEHGVRSIVFDTLLVSGLKENELEFVAVSFLNEYASELGIESPDFQTLPIISKPNSSIRLLTFQQFISGIEVKDSALDFEFRFKQGMWRLATVRNRAFIGLENSQFEKESVPLAHIEKLTGTASIKIEEISKIYFMTEQSLRAARSYSLNSSLGQFQLTLDDETGEILQANRRRYSGNQVQLEVPVYERSYKDGNTVPYPLIFTEVVAGGSKTVTDGIGRVDQTDSFQIFPINKRSKVVNRGKQAIDFDGNFKGDKKLQAELSSKDQKLAFNSFTAVNRVIQFAKKYIRASETKYFDQKIPIYINVDEGGCNAYYESTTLNLYSAANGCANMAEVNDVIYHEWGHGLDDYTGKRGGITSGAFSEGIGDIIAAYLTGNAVMGVGFFTANQEGIRNLKNTKRYPADKGEVHDEGLIIGGAFWDLRQSLIEKYGEIRGADIAASLFFRHLLVADSYLESFDLVSSLDDDDSNPATPSPNYCLIVTAFKAHGLSSERGCRDDDAKTFYEVGENLNAGIFLKDKQTYLAISFPSDSLKKVVVCEGGSASDCSLSGGTEAELDGKNGDRLVYFVPLTAVKEGQIMTILVGELESNDIEIGRQFRLSEL